MGIGTVLTVPFFFAPDCSQEKLIPGGRKKISAGMKPFRTFQNTMRISNTVRPLSFMAMSVVSAHVFEYTRSICPSQLSPV